MRKVGSGKWEVKYPTLHFFSFVVSLNSLDLLLDSCHSSFDRLYDAVFPQAAADDSGQARQQH